MDMATNSNGKCTRNNCRGRQCLSCGLFWTQPGNPLQTNRHHFPSPAYRFPCALDRTFIFHPDGPPVVDSVSDIKEVHKLM